MARALKWVLIVVVGLVVLAAAGVAIILAVVDPNDYRDEIAQEVERRTGRELVIEGDIDLTFFPWLGLELGRTRLADAPGFGDEPFVSIDSARLAVALWPLLSERRVVLDKIVLDGLNLRLIRNAEGVANWEQLIEQVSSDKPEPAPTEPQPQEPQDGGASVAVESLGGLEINNAQLLYEDRQADQRYLLSPLNVEVSALDLADPIPVQASWVLKASEQPDVAGELSARVRYDQAAQQLAVENLALDLLAKGEQVPSGELPLSLRGDLAADLAQDVYKAPALVLQAAGVELRASLEAQRQGEALVATGQLDVPAFDARQLMQRLAIEPPTTADPQVLTDVSAQARFRYADGGLALPQLQLELDDSTLQGSAAITAFSPLAANFKLAVDQLNLDRYLPPQAEEGAEPVAGEGEAPAPAPTEEAATELPVELLRELNLDGVLTIGQLTARGLKVNDFRAELRAKNGQIRLEPMTAQLYDGAYRGTLRLDASGAEPTLALEQQIDSVQAGPLLQDLTGEARVLGRGNLMLNASTQGATVEDLLRDLDGKASFKFLDGAVAGINIAGLIREAQARLTPQAAAADEAEPTTDFSVLAGSLTVEDGVVANRDLNLKSPLLRVIGEGKVNLLTQELAYLLTVNLVKSLEGQGGKELTDLSKIPIPIRITGSFSDLNFKVDLLEAIKQSQGARLKELETEAKARLEAERQEAEEKVRQRVEEEKQELRGKVQEKAGEALRDLFRQR